MSMNGRSACDRPEQRLGTYIGHVGGGAEQRESEGGPGQLIRNWIVAGYHSQLWGAPESGQERTIEAFRGRRRDEACEHGDE